MNPLKIAVISDVHLGHPRTSTQHIVDNLDKYLINSPDFEDLDILFIAGDLFDRLLAYDDPDRAIIYLWFTRLNHACAKHQVMLRLLKGTPSHDWEQCDLLPVIHTISNSTVDFKYVRTLSIEYIPSLNIHVLYVPDEWRSNNDDTLQEVKELLKSKGLEQVDYAIMHGNFAYQLPPELTGIQAHREDEYLKIVKQLIFIGHVHTHSRYERIVAQGSFDRLSHNEEEPKGFCIAHVNPLCDTREVYFIENKGARIYKSIDCIGLTLTQSLEKIKKEVEDIVDYSAVRIVAEKECELFTNLEVLLRLRPLISWSTKAISDKDKDDALIDAAKNADEAYKAITITPTNIMNLVFSRAAFTTCSVETKDRAMRHLEELR